MSLFSNFLKNISAATVAAFATVFCAFLLSFAFVLEYFVELTPCPLCIAQRFFFFLIGLTAFCFLWWPRVVTSKIVGIKITAFSLLGGAIAARQVWMQWHPATQDSEGCGVLLGNFVQNFLQAFGGSGDCSKVDWTWASLSIAEWSFLSFALLFLIGVWFLIIPSRKYE